MNTNDKTNSKLEPQNKDEAIAEVSATEAEAVSGGELPPGPNHELDKYGAKPLVTVTTK